MRPRIVADNPVDTKPRNATMFGMDHFTRLALVVVLAACGSTDSTAPNAAPPGSGGSAGSGGAAGTAGSSATGGSAGSAGTGGVAGTAGAAGSTAAGNADASQIPPPRNVDLCAGLITDTLAHPMTAAVKPPVGAAVTDAEFGTTIRRITAVDNAGTNPAIRPLYSTVAAWNADETSLILYRVGKGHELYNGKTYQIVRTLYDISPADLEQVYWHTSDPDVFYYVDGKDFVRYHVATAAKETVTSFSFCTANASGGSDPMFTSFDSNRIGLGCGDQSFIYDIATNTVIARKTYAENPAQISPSGKLGWLSDSGRVTDLSLGVVRTLDLREPFGHSSMGMWPTGEDTWNGVTFDDGPAGNTDIGSLVTFDMTTGKSKVVIGPKTGYPYPPTTHVSAMAYRNPGWCFVSTFGDTTGKGLLDLEITIANTVTGTVCRVGRHRSWGKSNTNLADPYWAEAHAVPSPSGTRVVFASDWGNGATVDTYVLELPSYQ
jgi:hypothetical protein